MNRPLLLLGTILFTLAADVEKAETRTQTFILQIEPTG